MFSLRYERPEGYNQGLHGASMVALRGLWIGENGWEHRGGDIESTMDGGSTVFDKQYIDAEPFRRGRFKGRRKFKRTPALQAFTRGRVREDPRDVQEEPYYAVCEKRDSLLRDGINASGTRIDASTGDNSPIYATIDLAKKRRDRMRRRMEMAEANKGRSRPPSYESIGHWNSRVDPYADDSTIYEDVVDYASNVNKKSVIVDPYRDDSEIYMSIEEFRRPSTQSMPVISEQREIIPEMVRGQSVDEGKARRGWFKKSWKSLRKLFVK